MNPEPPVLEVFCLDNVDSFVFNLVDEFARRGCRVETWRNTIPIDEACERVATLTGPRLLLLSPGPGCPQAAGCLLPLIDRLRGKLPMFGVCLGFQAIVTAYGGRVGPSGEIMHGKATAIEHDGHGLFAGCPSPMSVARYHSLAALEIPDTLAVTASGTLPDGSRLPMAVEDPAAWVTGVQFHPESILSRHGGRIIENVIELARRAS